MRLYRRREKARDERHRKEDDIEHCPEKTYPCALLFASSQSCTKLEENDATALVFSN